MNDPVQILLVGASGRMGREICLAAARKEWSERVSICAGVVGEGNILAGKPVPGIALPLAFGWIDEFSGVEVVVDYSSDSGAKMALEIAMDRGLPLLLASTGLSQETLTLAAEAENNIPIIIAANTSLVVTAMKSLVRDAARMLGPSFDVELVEIHHRNKKDAPSGTALMLLQEVAKAQGKSLDSVLETGRSGLDSCRTKGSYGAQAVRGGDVAGEHTMFFFGEGERLEITQRATNRSVFAEGALRAAVWLKAQASKGPGLFTMEDVLKGGF